MTATPDDEYLPSPQGKRAPAEGSSARRRSVASIVILVVDDSAVIRGLVCAHLQQRGFDVISAGDGHEAVALLATRKVDILVTDLQMPNMDGRELLEVVQDQYPLMRRVVMTGYTTIENALDALKLGAAGFVPKPIELSVLDEMVDLAVSELRGWMRQLAAIRRLRRGNPA